MADYEINELTQFEWMQSRIPALAALVRFVPDGPRDAEVDAFAMSHRSRWYPLPGGTRVVVCMEREPDYDASKWKVEAGAWDHEHCDLCGENIPAMTLCWVTKDDPYVLLCAACRAKVDAAGV
jgi:hypothetical protein